MMKPFLPVILFFCLLTGQVTDGQSLSINRPAFFKDTSVMSATIITNTGKLFGRDKKKGLSLPAIFTTILPDGTRVKDQVLLEIRGNYRRRFCYMPPLKIIFNFDPASTLSPLKSLKLVGECFASWKNEQYLLREYIIYKLYNLLTDMSYRVRLLDLNIQDSSRKKGISEHAFLMEDIKDLAKRNSCKEWKKANLYDESTNRRQMTMVAIFQYMIGNTDWSVSAGHNTNLIVSKEDTLARPMVVPYDFDNSGLVNTDYSMPDEKLGIETVGQRLYRGFPRTTQEINEVLDIFRRQKEKMYEVINGFNLLTSASKREMLGYLDSFYELIKDTRSVKKAFIDKARAD